MKHSQAFVKLVDEVMPEIKEVSVEKVKSYLDENRNFHLVDVREDNEWEAGHIEGSVHIGRGVLERDIENIIEDKSAEIVLYCGGGYRSALAAYNAQKMGYTNIFSMQGGIREWRQRGYPENK